GKSATIREATSFKLPAARKSACCIALEGYCYDEGLFFLPAFWSPCMSAVTREAVEACLRQFTDPHLDQDPVSAGCLREVDIQGGRVAVRLELGYAAGLFKNGWAQMLQMALENLDGVDSARVQVDC